MKPKRYVRIQTISPIVEKPSEPVLMLVVYQDNILQSAAEPITFTVLTEPPQSKPVEITYKCVTEITPQTKPKRIVYRVCPTARKRKAKP